VAVDARGKIVAELLAEFVEERVRQQPAHAFGINEVKQALASALHDAGDAMALAPSDDRWIADRLDRHPFLLKAAKGRVPAWRPGLNRAALGD
jgi:hypothetical protein